jgi:cytochrome P450
VPEETVLTAYRDVAEAFLPKPKDAFTQASYEEAAEVYAGALITLDGDPHHRRRRIEMPLFTRSLFQQYEGELFPELTEKAFGEIAGSGRADLVQFAHIITVQFAARVTGFDGCETVDDALDLYHLLMKMNDAATVSYSTRPHDEVFAEMREAREELVSRFFEPSLARRRAELAQAGDLPPGDLLSVILLKAEQEPLDDAQILREATLYGIASAHTSATALVHAFNDLFGWLDKHPQDRGRLTDLDFLQEVVYETLRLHPSSPAARRRVQKAMSLGNGTTLEVGQLVVLDLHAAGRDREVFGADADEFHPGRAVPDGVPPYGLTFGGGPHACIGRDLAAGPPRRAAGEDRVAYGTITKMLQALLENGAHPDPEAPPERNADTKRDLYTKYPIVLSSAVAA